MKNRKPLSPLEVKNLAAMQRNIKKALQLLEVNNSLAARIDWNAYQSNVVTHHTLKPLKEALNDCRRIGKQGFAV